MRIEKYNYEYLIKRELLNKEKLNKQKKIIDRLSRKIQNKNALIKHLKIVVSDYEDILLINNLENKEDYEDEN